VSSELVKNVDVGRRLRGLFEPRSVALIGASDRSRWSFLTHEALTRAGFDGDIHLVNPTSATAHGQPCVPRLTDIDGPVDLAFVMVPSGAVLAVLEEAAALGIRNAVVLSSGFGEAGEAGRERQAQLTKLAEREQLSVIGPNTLGFIQLAARVPLFPGAHRWELRPGPVGIVSQSGALAGSMIDYSDSHAIGLSALVATGNEAVVGVADVIDYLIEEENTRAIAVFLESIRDPHALMAAAGRALDAGKPIVALKVGRSEAAARTAAAHTGALVGDDRVVDGAFRQLGIVRVDSLEEMLTTAGLLARTGKIRGRRLGVAGLSGGACDIIADRAEAKGIELTPFAPQTEARLRELLPAFATAHNPLDVTGAAVQDSELFASALTAIGADPGVDVILCQASIPGDAGPSVMHSSLENIAGALRDLALPAVFCTATAATATGTKRDLVERVGLPLVEGGVEMVLSALRHGMRWSEVALPRSNAADRLRVAPQVHLLLQDGVARVGIWSESRSRELLSAAGIAVVPAVLVGDGVGAAAAAAEFGGTVVLKIVSPDIPHKTDVGGVRLGVRGDQQAREAADSIFTSVRMARPDARIDGLLVSPMREAAAELIVGVFRDPDWGLALAVGLGGIWTELFDDVSIRLLPVTPVDVELMLAELRGTAILDGYRGAPAIDRDQLAQVIARIGELALELGDALESLEVNPLRLDVQGPEALDALVIFRTPEDS
jgi:acyl-CoA synthetase (NDP forming)